MVKIWHSLYDVLKIPLLIILAGIMMVGVGSLLISSTFDSLYVINIPILIMIGRILSATGTFILSNFPLLFLLRLVTRKTGSSITVPCALCGYVAFAIATMLVTNAALPAYARQEILGISLQIPGTYTSESSVVYPLNTGLFGALCTAGIVLLVDHAGKKGVSRLLATPLRHFFFTIVLCALSGTITAWLWPYFYAIIARIIITITVDTANPVNLALYGVTDRILSVLNLNTLIRTPFWYTGSGGTWISQSGTSIAGDVSIWTAQTSTGIFTGMSGRFITPFYVLNIFAVPAMLWAIFSIQNDRAKKKKMFLFLAVLTLFSIFTGILLPVELFLLLFAPLLFVVHCAMSGLLFALMQSLQIYIGYNAPNGLSSGMMPGSLMELFTYISNPGMQERLTGFLVVGVVTAVFYFVVTRFYFRHMALDLFHTGRKEKMIDAMCEALGGAANIHKVTSLYSSVYVEVFETELADVDKLLKAGAIYVEHGGDKFAIHIAEASTMIRIGLEKKRQSVVRDV